MTKNLTEKLLEWYAKNGRDLPWRVKGRAHDDAYAVWISEIMLQQTTVKTVIPYYERFMKRFPDVFTLAAADLQDVLMHWQGLGYYTRARQLHKCAKELVEQYGGAFPKDRKALMKLSGIGAYTSAAIMSFGFNLPEAVVDGNVVRVLTRLKGWQEPVTSILFKINELAQNLTSLDEAADYSSAIMDLGATVCTPSAPACPLCPWKDACAAFKENTVALIPNIVKPAKAVRKGLVFLIRNDDGAYLVRRRTEKGLLSGLTEFPWNTDGVQPFDDARIGNETIKHVFTHFELYLTPVFVSSNTVPDGFDGFFLPVSRFDGHPFSTLMKKVAKKFVA